MIDKPQILNIVDEHLADINLTGFKSIKTGIVIGIDHMRQVLRRRQLTPHGSILAPVVVIPNEDNDLIIVEVIRVRTRGNEVQTGISFEEASVATGARFQYWGPGFRDDIASAEVTLDHQRIDSFTVPIQFGHEIGRAS